jgi:hypothetical protein
MRDIRPDASYHLTPPDRERVRSYFNVDALERLLQHLPASSRSGILAKFLTPLPPLIGERASLGV